MSHNFFVGEVIPTMEKPPPPSFEVAKKENDAEEVMPLVLMILVPVLSSVLTLAIFFIGK